jgi:hypothetical protein
MEGDNNIKKTKNMFGIEIEEEDKTQGEEESNVEASKTIPPISKVNKPKEDKKSMVLQIIDGRIVEREMTEEEKNIKYDKEVDVNSDKYSDEFKKSLTSDNNPHKESNKEMLKFIEGMKAKNYEMTINMIDGRIASVDILTPDLDKFKRDFEEVTGYEFEEKQENKEESKNNSKEADPEVKNAEKEVEKAKEDLEDKEKNGTKEEKQEAQENLITKESVLERFLKRQKEERKQNQDMRK